MTEPAPLLATLRDEEKDVIDAWLTEAQIVDADVRKAANAEASELLRQLRDALQAGSDPSRLDGPGWAPLRDSLATLSRSRAAKGRTAGETSLFVLALKKPLFDAIQRREAKDPAAMGKALWALSTMVDQWAQQTVDTYQRAREDIIRRQQEELLELSTPVVKLWEGVLAVPMIGVLDSSRTQMVMEALLQEIVATGSELAIIDITGVPTVDTLVAQHLLKTVTAIRLMGADCIISGIRPQIAQTIVHLGIDLQGVRTKATLADALDLALRQTGWRIERSK
ncbi:Stressosome protein RsbRA [Variovorax sp. PBS-H4]|uniref:STAS domain-containing protein n=1 Tax=Variovorax sp. PBS-H4 TaxID=434008 RepID=UPI001318CA51|nr:STAS domain-containing protein [Variovorax sp. PBS-H4]VTU18497.1 Stressosome protein RsbRA [Variovorax sp. PBS-H4]